MNKVYRILRKTAKFLAGCAALLAICVLLFVASDKLQSLFPAPYHPWIIGTVEPPGATDEILTVNANVAQNVFTQRRYAGLVMIEIRAPWLYVPPTPVGNRYPTPVTGLPFGLENFWVDNVQLDYHEFIIGIHGFSANGDFPYYYPVYGYRMLYRIGDTLRPIAFRMENPKISNDKTFDILVSIDNRLSSPGR